MSVLARSTLHRRAEDYFPYSNVRPFQNVFINSIYEAVENGSHILIEGSNGLGKTVAALSACLPVAKEKGLKVLYVAKTHRQHDRVIEELCAISEKHKVSGLSICGRNDMCFHSFIARNAPDAKSAMEICELLKAREQCPYYANIKKKKGFFNELRMHVSSSVYKASEIREICKVQGFCPYELVKEALEDVDVVALSYMYVFEPAIRGAFLKHLDKPLNKVILIVDEAHNLPDAALEIASENLTLFTVRQAQLESEKFRHKETEDFTRKFRIILEQMTSQIEEETYIPPQRLTDAIQKSINIKEPQTFFEEMHETGNLVKQELLTQGKYPRSYIHSVGEFFLR